MSHHGLLDTQAGPAGLSRRGFLKVTGAGIFLSFVVDSLPGIARSAMAAEKTVPTDFNAFLRIAEDGRVTCYVGKVEYGQGVNTSLRMMLADELDVAFESTDIVMGDTAVCPWDRGTWGSLTTRVFGPSLRAAGAEARQVLIELTSKRLQVPVDRLTVEKGMVFDRTNPSKRVGYGELARGKRIERHATGKVEVKKPSEFKIMGTSRRRDDGLVKVTGAAKYAGDIRVPGMLYARVLRPPAHGAELTNVDVSGVAQVKGARVVRDGDFIAVVAALPELAELGRLKIKAEFKKPASTLDQDTIFDHLVKVAPEGSVVAEGGNLKAGAKASSAVVEQTYYNDYVAHAPMEPHTALARFEGPPRVNAPRGPASEPGPPRVNDPRGPASEPGPPRVNDPRGPASEPGPPRVNDPRGPASESGPEVTVWASTQNPFGLQEEIAKTFHIDEASVHVITPFVGGGFGGKSRNLQALEAVRCAKLAGAPVQVAWTREEEFFYDSFRPAAVVKIKSGVAKDGRLALWDYQVFWAGDRGAAQFYSVADHRTVSSGGREAGAHPFAVGPWRAPANNTNTFARESQIDIMAERARMDPVDFRRKNLTDTNMRRVLDAAADKFGWKPRKHPSGGGTGRGVALGTDAGTLVAMCAEVSVDRATGEVRVQRVVCAQDMGLVVNPAGATIQTEGGITMGLGYALREGLRFKGGEVLDDNFDTYHIPRFSWVPRIESVLIDNKEAPPQGGGEPAIIAVGAAVANAVYDAIGARLYRLPMTPERIKVALSRSARRPERG
jgi:CO/xanthine dehydrogenase Mo-binding subunit